VDLWERQGRGLDLDRVAFLPGEPTPRVDRDDGAGPTPRAGDFATDQEGARPDTGCPEGSAMPRMCDKELSIHTLEQVERVATGKEPRRGGRASRHTEHPLVGGQDERFSDRRARRDQGRAERIEGGERPRGLMPAQVAKLPGVAGPKVRR
jgi:hypothetical protein